MIRSELVQQLAARHPELTHHEAERVVACMLDTIADALASGRRVELRGFGAFTARTRAARDGRNPRTGEPVDVPEKRTPFFKAGKELRELVDRSRRFGAIKQDPNEA